MVIRSWLNLGNGRKLCSQAGLEKEMKIPSPSSLMGFLQLVQLSSLACQDIRLREFPPANHNPLSSGDTKYRQAFPEEKRQCLYNFSFCENGSSFISPALGSLTF